MQRKIINNFKGKVRFAPALVILEISSINVTWLYFAVIILNRN